MVGDSGIILKTVNSGTNWTALSSGTTNKLYSVFFTNANNGYAVGDGNTILKTIDGGISWAIQHSGGSYNNFFSVYFPDANTGYVVGEGETILKTTNGGTFVEEAVSPEHTFILYPNPANGKVTILDNKKLQGVTTICIYDITETLVMQVEIGDRNQVELYISTLAKGIYLVKIQSRTINECRKLVVN
ncbi:MAG: YCF48-related protein [Bacteroidetes bacterium]|nr:YCF48-related protein [Bacteroidota bacterium]